MKALFHLIVLIGISYLFSCKNNPNRTEADKQMTENNLFKNKITLANLALNILNDKTNSNIWNLSDLDTSSIITFEDYFTDAKNKTQLVLINGFAGLSAGTNQTLLILLACNDTLNIIWSGQTTAFNNDAIMDLNDDGIKEITTTSSSIWMGTCSETFNIINFQNGNRNILYQAESISHIDCGLPDLTSQFKIGDTLENIRLCSIIKDEQNNFQVEEIHTVKVFNGGTTNESVVDMLNITVDSLRISLR